MTIGLNTSSNINKYSYGLPNIANNCSFKASNYASLPQDTVEISSQNKKNKNWLYLVGGLLTAGVGAFAFLKYKRRPPKIKQLSEHLETKKFENVEEAVKFAKENFGIELEANNNLKLATFVNNRLVNYNNKMKGSVVVPEKIKFKSNMKTINGEDALMGWGNFGEMHINEKLAMEHLESKDPRRLAYIMKAFFHELGHGNHQAVCKDYEKMGNLKELKAMFINDKHYYDEFMNDIKDNKEVKEFCTSYALTSPAEFVADIFAEKMMNTKIPKEVERLYKKYGGRDIPPK